jgi:hypothetical protein
VGNIDLDSSGRGEMKRQASNIVWFLVNPLSFHTTLSSRFNSIDGIQSSLSWLEIYCTQMDSKTIYFSLSLATNECSTIPDARFTQKILSLMWMDARDGWMMIRMSFN